MKVKFCLPIIKSTEDEIRETIKANSDYDYFEVWADYTPEISDKFISELIAELGGKLIWITRRKNLEATLLPLGRRLNIIRACESPSLVDLDIEKQKQELDSLAGKSNINLLLSYHNYEETPPLASLREIIKKMEIYNPLIYKVATFCKTRTDSDKLLELQSELKQQGKKHIVLGMGEAAKEQRITATLNGNEMIFASANKEESSAPGQLTKSELEKIFNHLTLKPNTSNL